MADYDPDELEAHIREQTENIGVQAEIDQRQAQLDRNRDEGTWWAALMTLSQERGSLAATAVAGHNLKQFLLRLEDEDLAVLTAYLLHNTIHLISKYEDEMDIPRTVSNIIGPMNMLPFEKFAATGGLSCPECGADDAWENHQCRARGDNEPFEG